MEADYQSAPHISKTDTTNNAAKCVAFAHSSMKPTVRKLRLHAPLIATLVMPARFTQSRNPLPIKPQKNNTKIIDIFCQDSIIQTT